MRGSMRDCHFWLGVSAHVQPRPNLSRLSRSPLDSLGGIPRYKITQNERLVTFVVN